MKKIADKVYDTVLFNYPIKKLAFEALRSKPLIKNRLYEKLYKGRMESRMKELSEIPYRIMIENTNGCNAKCVFCPHAVMERSIGIMNMDLFRKIADEAAELDIHYFTVYGFGEPFLDPQFFDKLRYAKSLGLKRVTTNTNGSLIKFGDNARKLIETGIDEVYISIDAAKKETYENIRIDLKYDWVDEGIRRMVELKKEMSLKKPIITLAYVETEQNIKETPEFIKKWRNVVDRISISQIHNWTGDIEDGSTNVFRKRDPCRLMWTDMVVSWDGRVPLCCVDYENKVILGDTNTQSIKEIWGGLRLKALRDMHVKGEYGRINVCKDCTYNYHDKSNWWVSK